MGIDTKEAKEKLLAKLVVRLCACECGRTFKVLPESKQKFFSNEECPGFEKKKLVRLQYGKGARYEQ